jgi:hypothetical protein
MKKLIAIGVLGLLVFGAVISLRVVLGGRSALGDGDDWMLRGKPEQAIRSYEAAARWYLPLAPHVNAAYAKLRALADDSPTGLLAWRAIRTAARATRTLWQPHAADLAAADAHIAYLEARDGSTSAISQREAWQSAMLSEDVRANVFATILAGSGILVVVVGGVLLVRRNRFAAAIVAAGTVCWLVGLYNA